MARTSRTKTQISPSLSLLKNAFIGAVIGLVCSVIFSLVAALIISNGGLPQRSIMPISVGIIAVSMLIGSIVAGRIHYKNALVVGLVTAVISLAVFLLAGFFVPDENIGVSLVIKAIATLVPCLVGAVIGANIPKKY